MSHGILNEGDYALVKMIDDTDQEIHAFLTDKLSDNSEWCNSLVISLY